MAVIVQDVINANGAVPSVESLILPGWMAKEQVIELLTKECVGQTFDVPQAEAIWQQYNRRVQELPVRQAMAPARMELMPIEKRAADAFLSMMRQKNAQNIIDVIKINPAGCAVHQLQIICDRSAEYAGQLNDPQTRVKLSLPPDSVPRQLQLQSMPNEVRVKIPHAEFMFTMLNPGGFQIIEPPKYISVSAYDSRLLLWAGYHRSFAAISAENPDGIDRSLVVVLTKDADFMLSPDSPNQGVRDMTRGLRPPLLGDFLDERFCMKVRLRKKRCELWIQARVIWLDEAS